MRNIGSFWGISTILVVLLSSGAIADPPIIPPGATFVPVPSPTPWPTRTPFAAQFCQGGLRENLDRCLGMKKSEAISDNCCRILFLDVYSCPEKNYRFAGESAGQIFKVNLPCYAKTETDVCNQAALNHCEDVKISGKTKPGLKSIIANYLDVHFKGEAPVAVGTPDPILGSPLPLGGSKGKIANYYEGKDFRYLTAGGQDQMSAFTKPACDLVNDQAKGTAENDCGKTADIQTTKVDENDKGPLLGVEMFEAETSRNKRFGWEQREPAFIAGSWIAGVKCHINEVKSEVKRGYLNISPMCLAAAYDVRELHETQLTRMKKYFQGPVCTHIRNREFTGWLAQQSGATPAAGYSCADDTSITGANGQPLSKSTRLRYCYFEAAKRMIDQGAMIQAAVCEVYARSDRENHCAYRTSEKILEQEVTRKEQLQACSDANENKKKDYLGCNDAEFNVSDNRCHSPNTMPCYRKKRETFFKAKAEDAFAKPYCTDPGPMSPNPSTISLQGGVIE